MSDVIKHECGIALLRLLKPLDYYVKKYGTAFWGFDKMYLLMQKQHNRGQDGAGIAAIKFDQKLGLRYINRERSNSSTPIRDCFTPTYNKLQKIANKQPHLLKNAEWLKENIEFSSELFLGHLRYGTYGNNDISSVHPFIINNTWISRSIVVAGNFNLTNSEELFNDLVELGQHPIESGDTITLLETIANHVNKANDDLYKKYKSQGISKFDISRKIQKEIDLQKILQGASAKWDGGYVFCGMLGHGDAFVLRDPAGIRPAFYYQDEEVVAIASERPAIQTAFNLSSKEIKEIPRGNAIIIKRNGNISIKECNSPAPNKQCSFERIYFSRGTDKDIYQERKHLGANLLPYILHSINNDLKNTIFSYIPNTAQVAYNGLIDALKHHCNTYLKEQVLANKNNLSAEILDELLSYMPRFDQIAVKDAKLRTFITEDNQRDELVAHIYDITYGIVNKGIDNLVILDDSIVRGTTLKHSIIRMLDRLHPRKLIIASSAPQIRYPDCYGIDMSRLSDFVAFQASIELLKVRGQEALIQDIYIKCKEQENKPKEEIVNYVQDIYNAFYYEEISAKIAELILPKDVNTPLEIIYNKVNDLHEACPHHLGDWYFTGNYPTPGGYKVLNKSYINFIENNNERAW
ncbi:MAG: amidophosphoribosyltransferase [Bacteroidales bacterium]|nr:amidophosphoribosyltransferase [Bacteroidales bacterium]MDD4209865.1 amidophosphoribosyltransferase [Bacteroidales bacterium]